MNVSTLLTVALLGVGCVFFLAGTIGLLRFPDTHSRLHALTKADNLGLGFIIAALMLDAGSVPTAAKLFVIWLVVMAASSTSCYLLSGFAAQRPLSKG